MDSGAQPEGFDIRGAKGYLKELNRQLDGIKSRTAKHRELAGDKASIPGLEKKIERLRAQITAYEAYHGRQAPAAKEKELPVFEKLAIPLSAEDKILKWKHDSEDKQGTAKRRKQKKDKFIPRSHHRPL